MKSIRQLMKLAKSNHPIGLYPEGGRNWDGATDELIPSTAKLIKMIAIPVYVTFYKGGFLSRPRWASHSRRGLIQFEGYQLLSSQDIKSMSVKEIYDKMTKALAYNEFDWQKNHMIPFKGKKRAEHIERLLYKCPECGAMTSIESKNHDFTCLSCDHTFHMNVYGFIEGCSMFEDTHQWHQWQKSFIPEIIANMDTYHLRSITFEKRDNKTKEKSRYTANVTLYPNRIELEYDNGIELLELQSSYGFSITLLDLFEFFTNDHKYRLVFDPTRHLPIVFIYDLLNQLKENTKHE